MTAFTLLDGRRRHEVQARIADGRVRIAAGSLRDALGWEVHDETLCNDALCVPVPEGAALEHAEGIDLGELARILDRPLALDLDECAAALGVAAGERGRALRSLQAPEFTLPDLAGRRHSLAEHRGRRILLVAWASW
jgi:hypothetical protein